MKTFKNIQQLRESNEVFLMFKKQFSLFMESEYCDDFPLWQMRLAIPDVLNDFVITHKKNKCGI